VNKFKSILIKISRRFTQSIFANVKTDSNRLSANLISHGAKSNVRTDSNPVSVNSISYSARSNPCSSFCDVVLNSPSNHSLLSNSYM
jgi:type IV pilus biogenesis protein CpaD/CtpE